LQREQKLPDRNYCKLHIAGSVAVVAVLVVGCTVVVVVEVLAGAAFN